MEQRYQDYIEEFRSAMRAAGINYSGEIIPDGKIHVFHVDGLDKKGQKSGRYKLYSDNIPAGWYQSWKLGDPIKWRASSERKYTKEEKEEFERKKKERDEQEQRNYERAAKRAKALWDRSTPATEHDYLRRKGIRSANVRVSRGELVLPIRSADEKLYSLQLITADGQKRFFPGGRVNGGYATIKGTAKSLDTIVICEGYATGLTINLATQLPVAVAYTAHNLEPVARALKKKRPNTKFVICADNDAWTEGNPGITKATEAAKVINGLVVIPHFQDASTKPTDFNDLAQLEGLERVKELIESVVNPPVEQVVVKFDEMPALGLPAIYEEGVAYEPISELTEDGELELATQDELPEYKDEGPLFQFGDEVPSKASQVVLVLAKTAGDRVFYDELRQKFYIFDRVWRPVTDGDIKRRIQELFDATLKQGYGVDHLNSVFNLFKLKVGRGKDNVVEWDEREYVPVQNGLLNLSTKKLEPFDKTKKIDWILPYEYKPGADCPTFDTLIDKLSGGDENAKRLLVTFLAAIIRCRSDLQKYLELVGLAGSGKSSYMHVAQMLVGRENTVSSNMRQLGQNRFETAGFYGKRLAIFADEKDHVAEGTDVFKALTGGDYIRYEQKGYQQGESFKFDGLIIVSCNSPMTFEDYSGAIPRRRLTVHIDTTLKSHERDPKFFEKLSAEMPGILNKLLAITNEEIDDVLLDRAGERQGTSRRSLIETNPVYDWFDQRVIIDESWTSYVGSLRRENSLVVNFEEALYPNFVEWLESSGKRGALSLQKFTSTLRELIRSLDLPVKPGAKTNRGIPWQGIRLRNGFHGSIPTPISNQTIKSV